MLNGNSQIFIGKSFAKDLNQYFESPVEILCNNDASCFALAEAKLGAGLKYREQFGIPLSQQISIGIILGTGCGGGIISNGKILNGQNGGGGEIGHSTLISNGHSCYCGRKGCAEQYLCGPALERSYGEKIAARELFERAGAGEQKAIDCLQSYQKNLIEFLTNLTSIFDPHFFVLGGGLSKQALLYQSLEKGLHAQTFVPQSNPVVYQHKVSDSAGVIGAALLTLP